MVKVVNIVHASSTSHLDASASIADMESETDSRLRYNIVISFDASIIGDKLNSAVQLPNFRLVAGWYAHSVRAQG